jgi:DnaJ-class molecular chaperone
MPRRPPQTPDEGLAESVKIPSLRDLRRCPRCKGVGQTPAEAKTGRWCDRCAGNGYLPDEPPAPRSLWPSAEDWWP